MLELAVASQLDRLEHGLGGCAAVLDAGGDAPGDVAARRRARLCAELLRREAEVLRLARNQLSTWA